MRSVDIETGHAHERCTVMLFRTSQEDALLRRVRGEFREMPGMRLTIDQAARLWSIDRQTCLSMMDALIASHYLALDDNGRYRKAHSGY